MDTLIFLMVTTASYLSRTPPGGASEAPENRSDLRDAAYRRWTLQVVDRRIFVAWGGATGIRCGVLLPVSAWSYQPNRA